MTVHHHIATSRRMVRAPPWLSSADALPHMYAGLIVISRTDSGTRLQAALLVTSGRTHPSPLFAARGAKKNGWAPPLEQSAQGPPACIVASDDSCVPRLVRQLQRGVLGRLWRGEGEAQLPLTCWVADWKHSCVPWRTFTDPCHCPVPRSHSEQATWGMATATGCTSLMRRW